MNLVEPVIIARVLGSCFLLDKEKQKKVYRRIFIGQLEDNEIFLSHVESKLAFYKSLDCTFYIGWKKMLGKKFLQRLSKWMRNAWYIKKQNARRRIGSKK